MSLSKVEYKLRVFISSKCGGKYTVARKSLKKLLDVTGMVETYAFEVAPASSEDTQSAYLEYIDCSDLCVFLIDNEDGVPPAVLSEEKRAKDMHLKLIYLFCDENSKKSTPMQEEIKVSLSQKYSIVHEFADIVSYAYDSIMQDLIAVYRARGSSPQNDDDGTLDNNNSLNTETPALFPSAYSKFPRVCEVLKKQVMQEVSSNDELQITPLEAFLSEQLLATLLINDFDASTVDNISKIVLTENTGTICDVVDHRYKSQKSYYHCKYDDCISSLQDAFKIALEDPTVPAWISNDIAIDIRHVQNIIDNRNSIINPHNIGQEYLDSRNEPIYYPYLDRQIKNMSEEISNRYYTQLSVSPYTTQYGGFDKLFMSLANAFCIAQLHGSIVQVELTRDRLISTYSMLCTFYDDHDLVVEYIRLLVVNHERKKLDSFIRTYNHSIDILNGRDIDVVLDSIEKICDPTDKIKSKYIVTSRFGYYMSENTYACILNELLDYSMKWAHEDTSIFSLGSYIFDFFQKNNQRMDTNDIINFVCDVIGRGFSHFYTDCFKVLRHIDYSSVDPAYQERIKQLLIDLSKDDNCKLIDQVYGAAIIQFCKTASINYDDLEKNIAEKYMDYYKKSFKLEMVNHRKSDALEYIDLYITEAKSRNRTQGLNGVYSGYSYESLDVAYNIIKNNNIILNESILKTIIEIGIETLKTETQSVKAKMSAIKLIQLAFYSSEGDKRIWDEVKRCLNDNKSSILNSHMHDFFSKDSSVMLSFQLELFMNTAFDNRHDIVFDMLYSPNAEDSYCVIQFLKIINTLLEDAGEQLDNDELNTALLCYSSFMLRHREHDIKYYSTKCLTRMLRFPKTRRPALLLLSQVMDSGSPSAKIAVLTSLGEIRSDDNYLYLKQIINKGKSDNNYMVRQIASKEFGTVFTQ